MLPFARPRSRSAELHVIKRLSDGTEIIEQPGRRMRYRGCMKCLPPARIATPAGDVATSDSRIGAAVWTVDANGRRAVGA
jgi:hypothetical protein